MRRPYWIPYNAPPTDFPPLERALTQPDGLLAVGGDLSVARLVAAYRHGTFPWYSDEHPILWWSPRQRMVLFPEQLRVTRSLHKNIRNAGYTLTLNQDFQAVMMHCARQPRNDQDGTWITADMRAAYQKLHQRGIAHSVECWHAGQLVGGLYGVTLGKVFFGESMFSVMPNASKVAFARFVWQLQAWDYQLIDCQVSSEHLASLGATEVPRQTFKALLDRWCDEPANQPTPWPTVF